MDVILPRVQGKDLKLALGIERGLNLVSNGSTDPFFLFLSFHLTSGKEASSAKRKRRSSPLAALAYLALASELFLRQRMFLNSSPALALASWARLPHRG